MAYNLLKGKKGIIFGALNEMSIAWQVAEKCIEEGAEIVLTNTPLSIRMGDIQDFAAKHQIPLIPADATSVQDLTHLFQDRWSLCLMWQLSVRCSNTTTWPMQKLCWNR